MRPLPPVTPDWQYQGLTCSLMLRETLDESADDEYNSWEWLEGTLSMVAASLTASIDEMAPTLKEDLEDVT